MKRILGVFDEVMALGVVIMMAIFAAVAYVFIAAISPLWIIPYAAYKITYKIWQEKQYKLGQEELRK